MINRMINKLSEFDLIYRYFGSLANNATKTKHGNWCSKAIGDDCAVLNTQSFAGEDMLCSVDTMVAGVHFPEELTADLAQALALRAIGAALSDLAACGAEPLGILLVLTLPKTDESWLGSFSAGVAMAMEYWSVDLLGGDLSAGPLSVTVQVIGKAPSATVLYRSGANLGDDLYMSGCTGEAALALSLLDIKTQLADPDQVAILQRYWSPQPRLQLGIALRGIASAAIDISDGLLQDAGHIAIACACHIDIEHQQVPLSPALRRLGGDQAMELALAGGDDYELLFTAPPNKHKVIAKLSVDCDIVCTRIGTLSQGSGVHCTYATPHDGYRHFA